MAAVLRGLQLRTERCTGSRGRRPSTERRRDSALDGRRPRDPCHPSLRRCNPLSTAAAQSKSPGSKFFRKKRLSPREHGACCCDCDRGAPAHDVIGTPDTPPCGAATLAARQRPAPAPDPTPTAAEIFRVPNKKSINFLSDCNELLAQSCSPGPRPAASTERLLVDGADIGTCLVHPTGAKETELGRLLPIAPRKHRIAEEKNSKSGAAVSCSHLESFRKIN